MRPARTAPATQTRHGSLLHTIRNQLPGLCRGLHATDGAGTVPAQRILDLAWEWIGKDIGSGLALSSPSYRDQKLADLGKPLASMLMAAAAIGAASTRETDLDLSGSRGTQ